MGVLHLNPKSLQSFVLSDKSHERVGSKQIANVPVTHRRWPRHGAAQTLHEKLLQIAFLSPNTSNPLGEHSDSRSAGGLPPKT